MKVLGITFRIIAALFYIVVIPVIVLFYTIVFIIDIISNVIEDAKHRKRFDNEIYNDMIFDYKDDIKEPFIVLYKILFDYK